MDDLRWMWPSPFTWRLDVSRAWTVAEYDEMVAIGWGRARIGYTRWMTRPETVRVWWLIYVDYAMGSGVAARPWPFALITWLIHAGERVNHWGLYLLWRSGHLKTEEGCIPRWRDVRWRKVARG